MQFNSKLKDLMFARARVLDACYISPHVASYPCLGISVRLFW